MGGHRCNQFIWCQVGTYDSSSRDVDVICADGSEKVNDSGHLVKQGMLITVD